MVASRSLAVVMFYLTTSVVSGFPGRKMVDNWRERRKARQLSRRQSVATEPATAAGAAGVTTSAGGGGSGSCEAPPGVSYPSGALPLLKAATEAYSTVFPGELPVTAAQAPGRVMALK